MHIQTDSIRFYSPHKARAKKKKREINWIMLRLASVSKVSYLAAFAPRIFATALPQLPLPSRHTRFFP